MSPVVSVLSSLVLFAASALSSSNSERSFKIDYDNDRFLKDGLPFSYVAGEMHYFRIPSVYWRDRLEKLKAAGCTTVGTYVEWSFHELSPGNYNFSGDRDILKFLTIAEELDLTVLLRPGPYICAERDLGGMPPWLLKENPNMKFRTSDPSYTKFVEKWFRVLLPMIQPHLYGNGGSIIMVQIENEYGSYPTNDKQYLIWLRDLVKNYTSDAAVLYTADGTSADLLSRGKIPDVLATINCGPTSTPMEEVFAPLRHIQPKGPLVDSEMYVGWITYWGRTMSRTDTAAIVNTIDALMGRNISFSMYVLHGGTNFAFTSGSGTDPRYIADITSYDYDSPISEAGDLTPKYEAVRDAILRNRNISTPLTIQKISDKGDYGTVMLKPVCSLFDCPIGIEYPPTDGPINMEAFGQYSGFISYSTVLQIQAQDPNVILTEIRDRAIAYLDDVEIGTLLYTAIDEVALPPTYKPGQTLRLLVENMGRKNYELLSDVTKGMVGPTTVDRQTINNWTIKGYPFSSEDVAVLDQLDYVESVSFPAVFRGEFILENNQTVLSTYLSMENWGKGIVFINGRNIGRYWHIGPQLSLFVPGCYIKGFPEKNVITVVELHYFNNSSSVTFVDSLLSNDRPTSL